MHRSLILAAVAATVLGIGYAAAEPNCVRQPVQQFDQVDMPADYSTLDVPLTNVYFGDHSPSHLDELADTDPDWVFTVEVANTVVDRIKIDLLGRDHLFGLAAYETCGDGSHAWLRMEFRPYHTLIAGSVPYTTKRTILDSGISLAMPTGVINGAHPQIRARFNNGEWISARWGVEKPINDTSAPRAVAVFPGYEARFASLEK